MSIVAADLIFYSCASVPTDDVSTAGGAIDNTMRVALTQFTAAAKLSLTSSAADVRTVNVVGRLASGVVASEAMTLNGVTEVLSTNTYERLLSVAATTTNANTVTLKQGTGGTTVATIPPNEKGVHIQFQKSTSAASIQTRYEKQFGLNSNGTNALLGANVTLTADPQAVIQIGLATAVNDTGTVTNRTTAPAGVTFVDDGVAQNVPGTDLAAGSKIGVWVQQTLAANAVAAKSTFTIQIAGGTT